MRVLYISPFPPPKVPGTDGLFKDIEALGNYFGSDLVSLSPVRSLPPLIPVSLYGMHQLPALKRYEKDIDLFHLFYPYLVNFSALRFLSRPIVYSIIAGIDAKKLPGSMSPCSLVVSSVQEAEILRSRGFPRVHVIRPGIDISRIRVIPPEKPDSEFVILAGSAPWTGGQFETKGFDLLLKAMIELPQIKLICLWRGLLHREWSDRVHSLGLSGRVEIIQEKADISAILSRCHAAVVLSASSELVKSYPNSLMESLVAGRPVFISRSNPMSYYVEDNGCGKVIENLFLDELVYAIQEVMDNYSAFARRAQMAGGDLSADRMLNEYLHLYQSLMDDI